jgi:hypothetical protein
MVRSSGRDLNKSIKDALACKARIIKENQGGTAISSKTATNPHPFGEDVKMVRQHKLNAKLLTATEKDEAVTKYESGMNITEVSKLYGCHYTTIGRLLRQRGVRVRE